MCAFPSRDWHNLPYKTHSRALPCWKPPNKPKCSFPPTQLLNIFLTKIVNQFELEQIYFYTFESAFKISFDLNLNPAKISFCLGLWFKEFLRRNLKKSNSSMAIWNSPCLIKSFFWYSHPLPTQKLSSLWIITEMSWRGHNKLGVPISWDGIFLLDFQKHCLLRFISLMPGTK